MTNVGYLNTFYDVKIVLSQDIIVNKVTLNDELLTIKNITNAYGNLYVDVTSNNKLFLYQDLKLVVNDSIICPIVPGNIGLTNEFNDEAKYDGILGCNVNNNRTTLKLYAPMAKDVKLVLEQKSYSMTNNNGLFEISFDNNLTGSKYYYSVCIFNDYEKCLDPYSYSTSINFEFNYVVDLKQTYQLKYDYVSHKDPIIYEISIRDMTFKKDHGTFIDLVNNPFYIDYLNKLGVNTIQIMPVFTFGGVKENNVSDYNWGYNPISYFSVSNYLTYDKYNYIGSINELKQVVDLLHQNNFSVVFDVVYNHTYDEFNNALNILYPGYAYTMNDGKKTSCSGCGNDLETNHYMIRKLIIDSLTYITTNFKADGFRFDLMGLIDNVTLIEARKSLLKLNPNILLYGEGWKLSSKNNMGTILDQDKLPVYGFFNGEYRNLLKPDIKNSKVGFLMGDSISKDLLYNYFTGSLINGTFLSTRRSVNYVECHDNYTFLDTLKIVKPYLSEKELIDYITLSLGCVMFSVGIPFFHLGEEFGRFKKFVENSYNSGDFINEVNFDNMFKYNKVINSFKFFSKYRLEHNVFLLDDKNKIKDCIKTISNINSFALEYNDEFIIIFKNDYQNEIINLKDYRLIYEVNENCQKEATDYLIDQVGIYIFEKESGKTTK